MGDKADCQQLAAEEVVNAKLKKKQIPPYLASKVYTLQFTVLMGGKFIYEEFVRKT